MKKIVIFLTLLIWTFAFVACDQAVATSTDSNSAETTLTTETDQTSLKMFVIISNLTKFANYEPLLETMISETIGMDFDIVATTNDRDFLDSISKGRVDLALVSTRYYLDVFLMNKMKTIMTAMLYDIDEYGLRMVDSPLIKGEKSLIIAKKDSDINQISDLIGKRVAISSLTSASSWLWPANLLLDHGIDPLEEISIVISNNQSNQIDKLLHDAADVAFIAKDARYVSQSIYPYIFRDTVVIAETPLIPRDILFANKNISQSVVELIQQALITLSQDETFVSTCEEVFYNQGFGIASDEDYVQLRLYIQRAKEHLLIH
jgi:phosphonate transport system substrate-binding protein